MEAVRLHVNGQLREVHGVAPTTTLLEWLRGPAGLPGTKEGCAEGDCGACTVVVVDPRAPGGPRLRAVNSCLLLLPLLHGMHVITVEGLRTPQASDPGAAAKEGLRTPQASDPGAAAKEGLRTPQGGDAAWHPVQEALVAALGSQCGYCTPGVIMSMIEACYRGDLDAGWKLDDQMCGNLCRCTGYRPIREATHKIAGLRPDDHLAKLLREGEGQPPLTLRYEAGQGAAAQRFFVPGSLPELFELMAAHPELRLVTGATDLGLDVTKKGERFPALASLQAVAELRRLEHVNGQWSIGATVRLADLEDATDVALPPIARMLRFFGSRQIKNSATVGGNLCNASPIGDLAPVLLALGATVVLGGRGGERRVPIDEFFVGYRKTALRPGELLVRVELPDPSPAAKVVAYKVSKRREMDISAVAAGLMVVVEGGVVTAARLGFGGMAATPARARAAEAALVGQRWSQAACDAAAARLADDFAPLSDHRGSAWYRATVAANFLRGMYADTLRDPIPRLPDRPSGTLLSTVEVPS